MMPNLLSATEAIQRIRDGTLSSTDLVSSCVKRIEENENLLKAWAHLDPEHALSQAAAMDAIRRSGRPLGALHGVPVGLKDIIDTRDFRTECGSDIFQGRRPDADAGIVERLRDAGAVVIGKTVSTELAFMHPAETRNPHNAEHTPGGSSSGSAAAVASHSVPLAIGSQTNGSVIRPASFCGTFGFKPTRGVISRRGVLQTSVTLDQVGVFGRTLQDVALLTDVIAGYDQADPASYPRPRPQMLTGAESDVPVEPVMAWFDLPFNDRLRPDTRDGLEAILEIMGNRVERIPAPDLFADLIETQRTIHEYEIRHHLETLLTKHWDKLSSTLKPVIERAGAIGERAYEDALSARENACSYFDQFFKDYDAIIAPSAAGEAPKFEEGTGDPVFCTIWTLCGLPSLNLPLLIGAHGLPIGMQLIGAVEEDDRLLRTANWILKELKPDAG